jgi:hypothetical protein
VKGDIIDRVDIEVVLTVALEGEILCVVGLVDVVHGDSSFDGSEAEAALVGKGGDAAGLVLKRGGHGAERNTGLVKVDYHDLAVGRGGNQQLAPHVDGEWPLGQSQRCARSGRLAVPVPDGMVPRCGDKEVLLRAPEHIAYGSVMRSTLHRLVGCQVPHLGSFVGAPSVDPRPVPRPTASKNRRVVRSRSLWHCGAVGLHLPAADLVVPGAGD